MRKLADRRHYRVEIAPAVWRDLGQVPSEAFKRMQAELENISELSSVASSSGRSDGTLHRVQVDSFQGIYEVDSARAVVRLISVHRVAGAAKTR